MAENQSSCPQLSHLLLITGPEVMSVAPCIVVDSNVDCHNELEEQRISFQDMLHSISARHYLRERQNALWYLLMGLALGFSARMCFCERSEKGN